jgi:hypothetical protein
MNVIHFSIRRATLVPVVALLVGQALIASAQTVLIDFGSNTSYRGLSVTNPDSKGNYWNSVQPGLLVENLINLSGGATTIDLGWDTPVATDSYNGPAGATDESTLTSDVELTNIDADALGNLGGALEAAFDYAAGYNGVEHFPVRFQIQGLDPTAKYNLTFFGSHKFSDDATTVYTVYTDSAYTTSVASASLLIQDPFFDANHDRLATINDVSAQTDNILYIQFVGETGKGGYLNALQIEAVPGPLAGDYNGDHAVNGADLAAWKTQFGQTGSSLSADGDANGKVDGRDFLIWQRNVGASSAAAVPEPKGIGLCGGGLLGLSFWNPRRRAKVSVL